MSSAEKIKTIEEEIARTQKNKATMGHLCLLKSRLAKLKKEMLLGKTAGGGGGPGEGFDARKSGDVRIGLIGFPSVGKSTLMSVLTGVASETASYEFTTLTCIPGEFKYRGCRIQLLDLPGIIKGAATGKGRGRQVIGVARTCDLIMIVLDISKPLTHKSIMEKELQGFGIRLNARPPKIKIKKLEKGAIHVIHQVKQTHDIDDSIIRQIAREYKLGAVEVTLGQDASMDNIVDAFDGNRHYCPCLYVLNMMDKVSIEELDVLARIPNCCPISGKLEWNFEQLKEMMWDMLDLIRVYTKPKGEIPDLSEPVVLPRKRSTVGDFCKKIHRTLHTNFKHALVWGTSVKFQPQQVGIRHQLHDEDVVQIVKRVGCV